MQDVELKITLKLSLQRALIGAVTENLFAVTASIENNLIRVHSYFSKTPSENDIETLQVAGTEVIADFSGNFMIEEEFFTITDHAPQMLDFWAFKRKH